MGWSVGHGGQGIPNDFKRICGEVEIDHERKSQSGQDDGIDKGMDKRCLFPFGFFRCSLDPVQTEHRYQSGIYPKQKQRRDRNNPELGFKQMGKNSGKQGKKQELMAGSELGPTPS